MGKIYFVEGLQEKTLEIIHEAHDCAEIACDLRRIDDTLNFGTDAQAQQLDGELREKYPTISIMLNVANSLPATCSRLMGGYSSGSQGKANLKQDYWGIICDTAIKKGLKSSFETCIDHVEEYR